MVSNRGSLIHAMTGVISPQILPLSLQKPTSVDIILIYTVGFVLRPRGRFDGGARGFSACTNEPPTSISRQCPRTCCQLFVHLICAHDLQAHELMDALKYNLRQEHIVLCDIFCSFHKILTPLQWATCIVRCTQFCKLASSTKLA